MKPPALTLPCWFVCAERLLRLFLIATAIGWLTGCEKGDASSESYFHQVAAFPVVQQPNYTVDRYFVGQVRARQRAELGFEASGTIAELAVDEGNSVEAGQLLATLDSRLLETELEVIAAETEDLQARRQLAQLEIQRQRDLIRQGFASEQRVDELDAELASLTAQLKKQRALLASAQTRLAKHQIVAPYAGEIARRYTEAGSVVISGQPVLQLLERSGSEARIGVPVRLLVDLNPGDQVRVHIGEKQLDATVLAVGGNVDAATRTATLRIALPAGDYYMDGEMLYLALPELVARPGFWIPDTALSASVRGMWNIYALVTNGESGLSKVEARSVDLLHMAQGKAFVAGAIADGELIVAAGVHRVLPGLTVRVADEPQQ